MKLSIQSLKRTFNKKDQYITPQVRICIECGSTIVSENEKGITCRGCGSKKKFRVLQEKGGVM